MLCYLIDKACKEYWHESFNVELALLIHDFHGADDISPHSTGTNSTRGHVVSMWMNTLVIKIKKKKERKKRQERNSDGKRQEEREETAKKVYEANQTT